MRSARAGGEEARARVSKARVAAGRSKASQARRAQRKAYAWPSGVSACAQPATRHTAGRVLYTRPPFCFGPASAPPAACPGAASSASGCAGRRTAGAARCGSSSGSSEPAARRAPTCRSRFLRHCAARAPCAGLNAPCRSRTHARTMAVLSNAHSCSSQASASSHGSALWGGQGLASPATVTACISHAAEPRPAVNPDSTPDIARGARPPHSRRERGRAPTADVAATSSLPPHCAAPRSRAVEDLLHTPSASCRSARRCWAWTT